MELSQLRAFVAVLDSGSLLNASKQLELSRTTVHARVAALEECLGVELLVRTHRGVEPTEFGRSFVEGARTLLAKADDLALSTARQGTEILGDLHIRASLGFPPQFGGLLVRKVAQRHPDLRVILDFDADPTQSLGPEVDVVLHFGAPPTSGAFRTFSLLRFPEHLLASPAYLERHGAPTSVEELLEHRLMSWTYPGFDGCRWPLRDGGELAVTPALVSNHVYTVRDLAARGHGVALLPDADIAKGTVPGEQFEIVLAELVGRESGVWVLVPEAQASTPRNRAAIRLLRELAKGLFCESAGA